jgi:hypothetical protein
MSDDFFDRLEAELGGLARQGTHLDTAAGRDRRRVVALIRRGALMAVLAAALAGSLISEFPASANGHSMVAPAALVRAL